MTLIGFDKHYTVKLAVKVIIDDER